MNKTFYLLVLDVFVDVLMMYYPMETFVVKDCNVNVITIQDV